MGAVAGCCGADDGYGGLVNTANSKKPKRTSKNRGFTQRTVNFQLYPQELCVVATDLSGFTYLTKKYGAIHFASVIVRMRQLLLPIIHDLSPIAIMTEADSFILVYENKMNAFFCGVLIKQLVNAYNETIISDFEDGSMDHFRIRMDGIGIDCGTNIYHDITANKIYGGDGAFHTAHLLGEEVANDGEFLISQRFYNSIREQECIAQQNVITFADLKATYDGHDMNVVAVEGDLSEFLSICSATKDLPIVLPNGFPTIEDDEYLTSNKNGLLKLCSRYDFDIDDYETLVQTTDDEIAQKYTLSNCTSIMFQATIESRHKITDDEKSVYAAVEAGDEKKLETEDERSSPDLKELTVKQQILCKLLSDVYDGYANLIEFGSTFLLFHGEDGVESAMNCAKQLQKAIRSFNSNDKGKYVIEVSGIGIHMGDILFIPKTDIVFGDAINTASKLGEDCAKNADIVITREVYDVYTDHENVTYDDLEFEEKTFKVSKNEIEGYLVNTVGSTYMKKPSSDL